MRATNLLRFAVQFCFFFPSIHGQSVTPSQALTTPADITPPTDLNRPAEPLPPLTLERRGDVYMARKMYREAIEAYRQAPEGPVIWNKLGIAYHQMSDLDTARRLYEKSLKLDPNYAEARNNLGTVYYARKSYRRAINDYRKALKLSPTSASIFSNLGTAYFARKKYKEAFEAYQQALNLDPEVFEHRSNYGVLLQDRTVEERAKFHYFLAKTYAQAGMNERALLYIRKSLEEGFAERKKYLEDPEFAALKDLPEFQTLMALEPRVL